MNNMEVKRKVTHVTDSPFSRPAWPTISRQQQETILELLCNLLEPITAYRSLVTPSKGRKSRALKRKRAKKNARSHCASTAAETEPRTGKPTLLASTATIDPEQQEHPSISDSILPAPPAPAPPPPLPPPELLSHLTIGLNSTLRALQSPIPHSLIHPVSTLSKTTPKSSSSTSQTPSDHHTPRTQSPLAAIIITLPTLPTILTTLLPQLLTLQAPLNEPSPPEPHLIHLPNPTSQATLSAALRIPQLSYLGISSDAPGTGPLLTYLRENVSPVRTADRGLKSGLGEGIFRPLRVIEKVRPVGAKRRDRRDEKKKNGNKDGQRKEAAGRDRSGDHDAPGNVEPGVAAVAVAEDVNMLGLEEIGAGGGGGAVMSSEEQHVGRRKRRARKRAQREALKLEKAALETRRRQRPDEGSKDIMAMDMSVLS